MSTAVHTESSYSSALRIERDEDLSRIPSGGRSIPVVMYDKDGSEDVHRIWVEPDSTFGSVQEALCLAHSPRSFVVLQPRWGPKPYWTESNPSILIGPTCRILYAVVKGQSTDYILGVVRTSLSDYPVAIFALARTNATILQAIHASRPELTSEIKSIMEYSNEKGGAIAQDSYDELRRRTSHQCPIVIITMDKPPKEFLVGSLYRFFSSSLPTVSMRESSDGPITPPLQIPFVNCKVLVQRAYGLDIFALQMIHLSRAILHIIRSLAKQMEKVFEKGAPRIAVFLDAQDDLADLLRVGPLLSRKLSAIVATTGQIMEDLSADNFDRDATQQTVEILFKILCGDFPGAVTVRHSFEHFKKLVRIDREEEIQADYRPKGITVSDHKAQHPRNSSLIAEMSLASEESADMDKHSGNPPNEPRVLDSMSITAFSPLAEATGSPTTSVNADYSTAGLKAHYFHSLLEIHSGNRPDGPIVLADALRAEHRKNRGVPLLDIQRTIQGASGVKTVTCGICGISNNTLQGGATHMISAHLKLNLWYCDCCPTTCARRWDLMRHRKDRHGVMELGSSQSKSGRKLDAVAETPYYVRDLPPPDPGGSYISVGGPMHTESSRSRSRSPFNAEGCRNAALLQQGNPYPANIAQAPGGYLYTTIGDGSGQQYTTIGRGSGQQEAPAYPWPNQAIPAVPPSGGISTNSQLYPNMYPNSNQPYDPSTYSVPHGHHSQMGSFPQPVLATSSTSGASGSHNVAFVGMNSSDAGPVGVYTCPHCHQAFDRPGRYEAHLNVHGNIRPFQCGGSCGTPHCIMAFPSVEALQLHIKKDRVQCENCGNLVAKKNISRHLKSHCSYLLNDRR